ncbi:hypothetical protein MAR_032775 [Mya arenaria]|uniref:Uncharacterized protein n=1 Tax=Mya arenaria TaxID=6604 RepID=A0ABY7GAI1_MYAAR|nr:hypothetical protein MAR_032775 [Mya arenaria]
MSAMLRLGKRKLRDHPTTTASNAKKLNNLNNQTPNQRTSRTTPQSLLTAAIGRSPTPATINANVQGKGFYLVSDAFLEQLHCQTPGPAFPFEVYHPAHISDSSRDKIDLLEVLQNGRFGTCIYDVLKESKSISKWVWKGLVQKSKNSSHDDYRSLKLIRCGYVGAAKHDSKLLFVQLIGNIT